MRNSVIVLHETGMDHHYRGLSCLVEEFGGTVEFREFHIIYGLFKSLQLRSFKVFLKQLLNMWTLVTLIFTSKRHLVLAISPVNWRILLFYYLFLKRHIVHYHTSWPEWSVQNNTKTYEYLFPVWKICVEELFRTVFCVSDGTKRSMMNEFHAPEKFMTVYHSIDVDSGYLLKNRDVRNILFVGRLVSEKGIDTVLQLALKLSKYSFLMAGSGPMQDQIAGCNYKNLSYLGYQPKESLTELYKSASYLVLPSRKEGSWQELFGMVIIEAMQFGVIPICTNHLGPCEIIQHGKNGFLFSEDTFIQEFVELISVLEFDEIRRKELRLEARNRALFFSKQNISERWSSILGR